VGQADGSDSLEEASFWLANPILNSPPFSAFSWKGTLRSNLLESDAGSFCRDQGQIRFVSEKMAFIMIITGRTLFKRLRKA
jgi:hypothetical protein